MHHHAELHIPAGVLSPPISEERLLSVVDTFMAPYSEHNPGPPVKVYLTSDEVQYMRDYFNEKEGKVVDDEYLKKAVRSWSGKNAGHDDGGYYRISTDNPKAFYDWYKIGGRWSGVHSEQYDPYDDKDNYEKCSFCNGTGFRNDVIGAKRRIEVPTYTCNVCGHFDLEDRIWKHGKLGPGLAAKWPTEWEIRPEVNAIPVDQVPDDLSCYAFIASGKVVFCETWVSYENSLAGEFVKNKEFGTVRELLEKFGITGGYMVTIDYHS